MRWLILRRCHRPCLFADHRAIGEGRLAVCRDDGPKRCGQTGLARRVMSRRLADCVARLEKTASLPCASQHTLQAFWTSCHLRRMGQRIPWPHPNPWRERRP